MRMLADRAHRADHLAQATPVAEVVIDEDLLTYDGNGVEFARPNAVSTTRA